MSRPRWAFAREEVPPSRQGENRHVARARGRCAYRAVRSQLAPKWRRAHPSRAADRTVDAGRARRRRTRTRWRRRPRAPPPSRRLKKNPTEQHLKKARGAVFDVRTLRSKVIKKERPEHPAPGEAAAEAGADPGRERGVADGDAPVQLDQSAMSKSSASAAAAPPPLSSFDGLDFANWGAGHPPDTNGDVGPTYYIQTINTSIGIYDKSTGPGRGVHVQHVHEPGHTSATCATRTTSATRSFSTTASRIAGSSPTSRSSSTARATSPSARLRVLRRLEDRRPGHRRLELLLDRSPGGLDDYPKFGIWPDGIYMSANMFGYARASYTGSHVWALNKAADVRRRAQRPGGRLRRRRRRLHAAAGQRPAPDGDAAARERPILRLDGAVPQRAVDLQVPRRLGQGLDVDVHRPVDAAGAELLAERDAGQRVDAGQRGRRARNPRDGAGPVHEHRRCRVALGRPHRPARRQCDEHDLQRADRRQRHASAGTRRTSPAARSRRMSSRARRTIPTARTRSSGSCRASPSTAPATWRSATRSRTRPRTRRSSTPAGSPATRVNTLGQTEQTLIDGTGAQSGNCGGSACTRWGDYSGMALDPNGCTFWLTNEYFATTGLNHQTRIGSFHFPSCTTVGNGTLSGHRDRRQPTRSRARRHPRQPDDDDERQRALFVHAPGRDVPVARRRAPGFTPALDPRSPSPTAARRRATSRSAAAARAAASPTTRRALSSAASPPTATSRRARQRGPHQARTTPRRRTRPSPRPVSASPTRAGPARPSRRPSPASSSVSTSNCSAAGCTGASPNITVSIRATTGATPVPTGADLASATLAGFNDGGAGGLKTVTFASPLTLTAGTRYAFIFRLAAARRERTRTRAVARRPASPTQPVRERPARHSTNSGVDVGRRHDVGRSRPQLRHLHQRRLRGIGHLRVVGQGRQSGRRTDAHWTTLTFTATTPASTAVKFQVAASNSSSRPIQLRRPRRHGGTFFTTSGASLTQFNGRRYLRYKAYLSTTDTSVTPSVSSVTVCFEDTTAASLSATPSSVSGGGSVTVSWSGVTSPTTHDWIGLYHPGDANSADSLWAWDVQLRPRPPPAARRRRAPAPARSRCRYPPAPTSSGSSATTATPGLRPRARSSSRQSRQRQRGRRGDGHLERRHQPDHARLDRDLPPRRRQQRIQPLGLGLELHPGRRQRRQELRLLRVHDVGTRRHLRVQALQQRQLHPAGDLEHGHRHERRRGQPRRQPRHRQRGEAR